MKLGLRLLQERAAAGSLWWPYIANLPEAFSVPIFFSGEEIRNLQYAPFVHQVNKRCRFLLEFEKEVKSILENVDPKDDPFEGQSLSASSLGWALSSVSTRAFRLHGEVNSDGKRSSVPMLLPLIDMCNHSFLPNARIIQEGQACNINMSVKVISVTLIEKDFPVMLNYGFLSNDFLLLDYGFIVPSNPYDHVELKYDCHLLEVASAVAGVPSPNFSSPNEWQQEILCQLNLHGEASDPKVILGGPELVDGRLMAALRVLFSNDRAEVRGCDFSVLKSPESEEAVPLGVSIEAAVLRTLNAVCSIMLESFPTKVMQDELVLREGAHKSMELAVQFRMQKKLMIIDTMRKLTKRSRSLSAAMKPAPAS